MTVATYTTRLTAAECLAEIEKREISITGWRKRGVWLASVQIEVERDGPGRRAMRSVSAVAGSPLAAVRTLVEKLDLSARPEAIALFEEEEECPF